jgi:hypothetical protein
MRTRGAAGLALAALAFWGGASSAVWAQTEGRAGAWRPDSFLMSVLSTLVFGLIGIVVAIVGFKLFDALIPFNLEQEICEKQNLAVAILCAGMVLGICLIVAAAVL